MPRPNIRTTSSEGVPGVRLIRRSRRAGCSVYHLQPQNLALIVGPDGRAVLVPWHNWRGWNWATPQHWLELGESYMYEASGQSGSLGFAKKTIEPLPPHDVINTTSVVFAVPGREDDLVLITGPRGKVVVVSRTEWDNHKIPRHYFDDRKRSPYQPAPQGEDRPA